MRLSRDELYLNIDTGVGVLYVFFNSIPLNSHSTCSYGQDLAQVCHNFMFGAGRPFRLQDLILDAPDESRASPPRREKLKREWEALVRFIKGLEVSVNFKTTKRYPRRKIVDLYPMAGRYQFVLEKADKKERRPVTVEVPAIVTSHQRVLTDTLTGILPTDVRPANEMPRRDWRSDAKGTVLCHPNRILQAQPANVQEGPRPREYEHGVAEGNKKTCGTLSSH